jgi:hypothetical protein
MIIDFINRIPNFGAIQATFNIIPSTNVEVEMTKQQISKLTPEEKTKLMFLAEVSTTTNRINQYFLTLLPVEAENLTEQQWSELIQKVQLALTNIETDITPLISAMQKRIFYAPDPESKKQWFEHLASFRKETSTPMETMLNKLDQLRKLNKIDKANFDILFNMVVDFLNRFDAAVNI